MSYQLIERPHIYSFSENPIRYGFNVSNPATPGSAMEVELYVLPPALNVTLPGELVFTGTLFPNPDGKVFFYCEDYLNSYLEWEHAPLSNNDILQVTRQIRKYYIRYRQVTKANTSTAWSTEAGSVRTVLKGGVAKEKFDRNNFFVSYLPQKKPFLTWLPDKHFIGVEERRYLTYFHHADTFPLLQLMARVVYTDGTQESIQPVLFPSIDVSRLFHIPVGLDQLGLLGLHPDKQIWYYDVSVEDDQGAVYATAYRMYADYRNFYNVFSLVYHNSLGGIDTLRVRGEVETEVQLTATDIQQATGGDFSGVVLPTEFASINISKTEVYKGDAGWMNTKRQQDTLQDLLLSDMVFREVGGRWLRVVLQLKSQAMGGSSDTKWSFPIQWRYTFDNTQYTPFDLLLGSGQNNEAPGPLYGICTAPSGLTVTDGGASGGGKVYLFSWNEVLDAEGYELEITDPNGQVTNIPLTDFGHDLILTVVGDYSWRVRTKCGANDFSGWSVGQGFTLSIVATVCTAPANIVAILLQINGISADMKFSWPAVPGVVGYVFEWAEVGAAVWNSVQLVAPQHEVVLNKDVQYQYRVKSKCNNTPDYSGYSYGQNLIPSSLVGSCAAPTNLVALVGSNLNGFPFRSVTLGWTAAGGAGTYELRYRIVGTSTWTTISGIAQTSYPLFVPINRFWEWQVFSNCQGGGISVSANGPNFFT